VVYTILDDLTAVVLRPLAGAAWLALAFPFRRPAAGD
jgi:hypothetical protein